MYGSSFMFATLRPRFSISAPIDAETIPLPREDTTPPVTNTNLVCCAMEPLWRRAEGLRAPGAFYRRTAPEAIARCELAARTIPLSISRRSRAREAYSPKSAPTLPQRAPPAGDLGGGAARRARGRLGRARAGLERGGDHRSLDLIVGGGRRELRRVLADE